LETQTWIGSPEVLNECMETVRGHDSTGYGTGRKWRGLLLEGEPGTGKTLLARKIAAEANASFIPVVGSQFVEMYVGLGAKRVRELFLQARLHAPVIVFIDEMDAIAGQRGYPHNTEADNTLNQLLAEMDGFRRDEGVFVLGATNRVALMDPALLRPGRFDRVVHIPLPDTECRKKMFAHFLRKCALDVSADMDYETLAVLGHGFSGAVIEKVVREAEVFARRNGETVVEPRHIDLAMEKEWMGLLKTEEDRSSQEILRVAVHEVGHALLAHRFFRVHKISIRANHKGVGGFTLYDPFSTEDLPTRESLQQRIAVLLGGRAAERLWYGPMATSTGAVQDLASANELAEAMITELGFSDRFPSLSSRSLAWSDHMRCALHDEIQEVLDQGLRDATRHLNETWGILQTLVTGLIQTQSMNESVFLSYIV
jgi:cell division protease FtsH